ncbi:MAG: hypothetical protein ACREXK_11215 [Gammaproteobacteria bacterium]
MISLGAIGTRQSDIDKLIRKLQSKGHVLADEKTSVQARRRRHRTLPTRPAMPMKVEHEYTRCGAWAYLAALDVHRGKVFGRCEKNSGTAAFDRLVAHVMNQPPYHDIYQKAA